MKKILLKSTTRGQVTLPKQWRKNHSATVYLAEMHDDKLIIVPFDFEKGNEEILFDADRDNDGKGVSPDDIIAKLQKIQHG